MKKKIGKYEILGEIGSGGFATVYKARHSTLQKNMAVKVLNNTQAIDDRNRERFLNEARLTSSLDHQNIIRIEKLFEEDDLSYFVMDYFPEGDLGQYASNHNPLGHDVIFHILSQVADALDYAHDQGILHRDVKPSNILINDNGDAILCDFGLVRQISEPHMTQIGSMLGTALYISPEQAQGKIDLDGNTDQYSLAVIAYELLVGQVPFHGDNSTSIALLHVTKEPPKPRELNKGVSEEVETVLLKALDKNPKSRFSSSTEFVDSLKQGFYFSQFRSFNEKIKESRQLLLEGKFDAVQEKIEEAQQILPDQSEINDLLNELEQARINSLTFDQCLHHWKVAVEKAKNVLEQYPNHPDPNELFILLGLNPKKVSWPFLKSQLLQLGIGLIVGSLFIILIFYSAFQIITG